MCSARELGTDRPPAAHWNIDPVIRRTEPPSQRSIQPLQNIRTGP